MYIFHSLAAKNSFLKPGEDGPQQMCTLAAILSIENSFLKPGEDGPQQVCT